MRHALPLACVLALCASPAASTPQYSISYWNGSFDLGGQTSSSPLVYGQSYALAPSNGTGTFTGIGYAGPGYVNSSGRVDCTWDGVGSGGFGGRVDTKAVTYDAIISGPASPGSVNATLNIHVKVNLARSGGFPDNNAHVAYIELAVNTPYTGTVSDLSSGNHSISGTGLFAGVTSPNVDMIVSLPGNFPVNVPFMLQIATYVGGVCYGNGSYSPGMAQTDAGGAWDPAATGVSLGGVGGQIMTLPAGYDFTIPSWGIANNTYLGPVGVVQAPPATLGLALAGANPTSGLTQVALSLPRDGEVRLAVYDLAGRVVRTLFDGWESAGQRDFAWDGRDGAGAVAPAGLYFVRADAVGRDLSLRIARVR